MRASSAITASTVNRSWPSRWWASRGALTRTATASTIFSMSGPRMFGRIHGQQRAHHLDEVGAGECAFVEVRDDAR